MKRIFFSSETPNPNLIYFSGVSFPGFSIPEDRIVYSWELYRYEIEKAGWEFRHVEELSKLKGSYETDFDMPYREYLRIKHLKLIDKSKEFMKMRMLKDRKEIRKIRRAVRLAEDIMEKALDLASPGMTEMELLGEIERVARKKGLEFSFPPIISHSRIIHSRPTVRKISERPLIIDLGVKCKNYCSDISRTKWMSRKMEKMFEKAFAVVEGWKGSVSGLDKEIRKIMDYPHATGHGIGVSVHEWPVISGNWEGDFMDGMVFTIEPAIYGRNSARVEKVFFYEEGVWEI